MTTIAKTATAPKQLTEIEKLQAALAQAEAARVAAEAAAEAAKAEAERARAARGISTMQIIRRTLAEKPTATVAEIRDACKAAGVPAKSDVTIKTIMSDFRQTFDALRRAGRIAAAEQKK